MSKVNSALPTPGSAFGNLNRLAYFVAVVEAGSFTAAADRLGVSKAVVSQQVARLEQDFRCTLLVRSTRSVRTTDDGQAFYQRASRILKEADTAFDELAESAGTPSGTLRVTAPLDYGLAALVPAAASFSQRFPECQVDISFSDQIQDLLAGNVDMGIRVGWLTEQQQHLQARRIGRFQQWLVAPASWAARVQQLHEPAQLAELYCVGNKAFRQPATWTFTQAHQTHPAHQLHPAPPETPREATVTMRMAMQFDATLAVQEAVLQGAGLGVLPDFAVQADVAEGRLIRVLPQWQLREGDIYAVFPAARFRSARVRAFIDLLIEQEALGASSQGTASHTAASCVCR